MTSTNLLLVNLLSAICNLVANDGANVLNDHGVFFKVFSSVETQSLNARTGQVHIVFPLCLQSTVLRRFGMNKLLAVRGVNFPCKRALIGFGHTRAVQSMRPEKQDKITLDPYNHFPYLKELTHEEA